MTKKKRPKISQYHTIPFVIVTQMFKRKRGRGREGGRDGRKKGRERKWVLKHFWTIPGCWHSILLKGWISKQYVSENLEDREGKIEHPSAKHWLASHHPNFSQHQNPTHISSIYSSYKYFTVLFLNHLHICIQRKINFRMEPWDHGS